MGAIVANASEDDQEGMYNFGINLGLAFQLQDDFLDTFGDYNFVGKKIGGDILENKKTVLFHLAKKNANKKQIDKLHELYDSKKLNSDLKIKKITTLFKQTKADIDTLKLVNQYTKKAIDSLNNLSINKNIKNEFIAVANNLMKRDL